LERAALLTTDGKITPKHLHFEFASEASLPFQDTKLRLSDVERIYIQKVIQDENGSVERAAERLGVPRSSLYKRIKAAGIVVSKVA
jgi:transcriptional regulator of acetoin/glycerol metabolism